LLAEQILLVSVVCIIIGAATLLFLHQFLYSQTATQLEGAFKGAVASQSQPHGNPFPGHASNPADGRDQGPGPEFLGGPSGFGSVGLVMQADGTITAGISNSFGQGGDATSSLTAGEVATLKGVTPNYSVQEISLGDRGDFLAIATKIPDKGTTVVLGVPLSSVNSTLTDVGLVFVIVAGAGLLLVGLIGGLIIRRTLRPLRRVAATAGRVAELPLDRGEVALSVRVPEVDTDPRTEVGQVGSALNRMLGHIAHALSARQASEMRVRQFVADASHELRTPLAAIRGYAELAQRKEADTPAEVTHALRRVESESARMTTLVEDLLLLARLDSGRPLDRETVDLSMLVIERVGDAHVAGPEHRWQLELPDEPVTVTGDVQRLHQVLANLLTNARNHTPPGTTVTTSVTVSPHGEAVLTVLDNGPGIPADLLPQVFDRFARGDTSRSRAAGSTGLGLAIVSAVVSAHHGTVSVESRPGRTAFIVRLPDASQVSALSSSTKDDGADVETTMPIALPDGPPIQWPTEYGNTQPHPLPQATHSPRTASAQPSRRWHLESGRHDRARP
jgi:two-component system OmpR family sensor kinase